MSVLVLTTSRYNLKRWIGLSLTKPKPRWDIFCRVIDNFGDIAVCWRLARQLSAEYGLQVRLWVDDLSVLNKLNPSADFAGVEVQHWPEDFPEVTPADVVIEAFACELPANYLAAMVHRPPLWINLEYLTAEPWAAEAHGLPSPHPTLPLTKYFFFPGFTPNTGGLLHSKHRHSRVGGNPVKLQQSQLRLMSQSVTGLDSRLRGNDELKGASGLTVSLFGYENSALKSLLEAWSQSAEPISCLVPESKLLPRLSAYFGRDLRVGDAVEKGSLNLKILPFLSQDDYDQLLWSCDLNFVRGEDSFVRAQFAGKPFVWHIYPQDEDAHVQKLEAFISLYCQNFLPDIAAFWRDWNAGQSVDWARFWQHRATMQAHAQVWQKRLMNQTDLASKLVNFQRNHI
ncbi:MAG: elongation factor P maturation arginine rhamnosyltransferase EarP [Methylophilaceae bacterium]